MSNLIRAFVVGGALAVLITSGSLLSSERAVVKVTVTPKPVQVADVALNGGSGGFDLATTPLTTSVTESQKVKSTLMPVAATTAAGRVTFWCSPMSSCPSGYTVAAGTLVESLAGVEYRTLSTVSFPSCAPSSPAGIRALSAGAAGNADAGAVVYGQLPGYIHVTNSSPIAGGADARTIPLVRQADVDAASRTLTAHVSSQLTAQLQAEAGGLAYVGTGAPAFRTFSDSPVGSTAPTFTVTVTGTLNAVAFSTVSAQAVLRRALSQRVAAGYHLTADPIDATFSLQAGTVLRASAKGYVIPTVDTAAVVRNIRGQSVASANDLLRRQLTAGTPDIQITPFALPWLPIFADHITVVVVAEPDPLR